MENRYYDDRDYDPEEERMRASAQCRGFQRRCGVTVFNMTDYRSCENCSHMTADNRCTLRMDDRFTDIR